MTVISTSYDEHRICAFLEKLRPETLQHAWIWSSDYRVMMMMMITAASAIHGEHRLCALWKGQTFQRAKIWCSDLNVMIYQQSIVNTESVPFGKLGPETLQNV